MLLVGGHTYFVLGSGGSVNSLDDSKSPGFVVLIVLMYFVVEKTANLTVLVVDKSCKVAAVCYFVVGSEGSVHNVDNLKGPGFVVLVVLMDFV